jgi:hypothetical protein
MEVTSKEGIWPSLEIVTDVSDHEFERKTEQEVDTDVKAF